MTPTQTHRPRTVETSEMRLRILGLLVERCVIGVDTRQVFDQVAGIVDLPTSEVAAVANMNGWPDVARLTSNRDSLADRYAPPRPRIRPARPAPATRTTTRNSSTTPSATCSTSTSRPST